MPATRRILIVDDDSDFAESTAAILRMYGCQYVEAAIFAKQAIAIFRSYRPHIVLMDYAMPVTTGAALARDFKYVDPNCRIVCVSGYPEAQLKDEHSSFDAFLLKPVESTAFLDCLTMVLAKSVQPDTPS